MVWGTDNVTVGFVVSGVINAVSYAKASAAEFVSPETRRAELDQNVTMRPSNEIFGPNEESFSPEPPRVACVVTLVCRSRT